MPVAIQLSRFIKLRWQVELPRLLLEAVSGDILCHDVPVGWTISLWSLGCDGERGVCTFRRVWMVCTKLSSDAGTVCDRKFMLLSRAIAQCHH
jgi:hypothetical protein